MLGSRSIELKTKSIHLSPAYKLQINLLAALLCTHGPMLPSLRINYSNVGTERGAYAVRTRLAQALLPISHLKCSTLRWLIAQGSWLWVASLRRKAALLCSA